MTDPEQDAFEERHEVPEDDRVIASAFRYSLVILIAIAVTGAVLGWWFSRVPLVETVEESIQAGPELAAANPERRPPAVAFSESSLAAGIDFVHVNGAYGERLLPETMGSGVAVLDFDGDGLQDLLFVNASPWPWRKDAQVATQRLYRNLGNGRFADVSADSGIDQSLYGVGVAVGDYDGDGHTDIFITALGENRLFHNDGQGRFEIAPGWPAWLARLMPGAAARHFSITMATMIWISSWPTTCAGPGKSTWKWTIS